MENKKFIEVYDNLLHPQLVDEIEYLLLRDESINYSYLRNITNVEDETQFNPGFNCDFIDTNRNQFSPYSCFISQVLYKVANHLNFNIRGILKARTFLQTPSPTPTPNGIHKDFSFPHWVCLYYVTDSDGDTVFFDDNKKEIKRVSPKKGRIAFFDGLTNHCSSSPSNRTRSIINFDFIGEKMN